MLTVRTRNASGATIYLINQAARGGRRFTPYYFYIPTTNGAGNRVLQVSETIAARQYVPDPSVTTSTSRFEGSSVDLPDGFIGKPYAYIWTFLTVGSTVSFDSGSIPPGLHFRMIDSVTWQIKGTPTTKGVFTFILRSDSPGGSGLLDFVVRILAVRRGTAYVGGN